MVQGPWLDNSSVVMRGMSLYLEDTSGSRGKSVIAATFKWFRENCMCLGVYERKRRQMWKNVNNW